MKRIRFTNGVISSMACLPGENCGEKANFALVFDTECPRLAVRITMSGEKSFVFDGYINRKSCRVTIGSVKDWGIDNARAQARSLQTLIDKGIDPREQERQRKESIVAQKKAKEAADKEVERRQKFTLEALCREYVEYLKSRGKNKSASDCLSAFRVHVFDSNYASKPASEVRPVEIAELVRKVYESGKRRTAGVLRAYLTAAYNAARKAPTTATITSGLIPFGISSNPADVVENIKTGSGERHLSEKELKLYVESLGDTPADMALKVALYSGSQRMAQLVRAKVSDYIADSGTLRIYDGKGKRAFPREHLVPMAPKGKVMLDALVGDRPAEAKIFNISPRTAGNRLAEICKAMKVEPFDLRDIRRTVETIMVSMGISKETRAQLLSHGLGGVQDVHYDKHAYIEEKRAALKSWELKLDTILTGKQGKSNVQAMVRSA